MRLGNTGGRMRTVGLRAGDDFNLAIEPLKPRFKKSADEENEGLISSPSMDK